MTVPAHPGRKADSARLRSRVERLEHLPVRPQTARLVMNAASQADLDAGSPGADWTRIRAELDVDPGWILAEQIGGRAVQPLQLIAELPWWSAGNLGGPRAEVFQRLWRHSVAVSVAARSLARETGAPHPDRLERAALLHGLARWAIAAIDPEWIVGWLGETDPRVRQERERAQFGTDLCDLGRRLAEGWRCDPLVVDAAWLHAPSSAVLNHGAAETGPLALIQQAFLWAEQTPWALFPRADQEAMPGDPRLRIVVAEVQSRCGSLFAAADATVHEEKMTRQNARLMVRLAEVHARCASQERLFQAMADARPTEPLGSWMDRVGMIWCSEPEVTAARIVWKDQATPVPPDHATVAAEQKSEQYDGRPPSLVLPWNSVGPAGAEIQLWCDERQPGLLSRLENSRLLAAWEAWASLLAGRASVETRLQTIVAAVRQQHLDQESETREARLQALAEFAAGAGHELNNPLAVIVGRAQLLLGRSQNAEDSRSLRIILNQAQRTHRILRDLMFVARPAALRPRACRPADVLRACLASVKQECEARGVRLESELEPADSPAWADPDALGHLAETLVRNAIQATAPGGRLLVRSRVEDNQLRWWFCDSGKGMTAAEGAHLFDPFYCGRQAGRGLGLGLPRAARIVNLAGGSLTWSSNSGQGTTFQVRLPLIGPPDQMAAEQPADRRPLDGTAAAP